MKRYRLPSLLDDVRLPPRGFGGGPYRGDFDGPPGRYGPPQGGMFGRPHDYYDDEDDYGPPSRFPRRELPMSPFLQRMMQDDAPMALPPKQQILLDLGESVLSSLKQGKKLSENPAVREKLETLIEVEAGGPPPPPLPARGRYDSFSRYDSFYDDDFHGPPGPGPFRSRGFPPPPRSGGFPLPPRFGGFPPPPRSGGFPPKKPMAPFEPNLNAFNFDTHTFLRVGKDDDFNRIYASERELRDYFNMEKIKKKPLDMKKEMRTRLKNTFSYEVSQCKNDTRRNWLVGNYNKIVKEPNAGPELEELMLKVIPKRKESRRSKEKRLLRDKRPFQSEHDRRITNYLKNLLLELAGEEDKEHCVLLLRAIHVNPNMIRCLTTECRSYMDKKFGAGKDLVLTNTKRSFLIARHRQHMEETRHHLLLNNKKAQAKEVDDSIYEIYDAILSGKQDNPEYLASAEHYIIEPNKSQEEFIIDFKYEFVKCAFEKFDYKVIDNLCVTQNRRMRINFFMNNGFLASLIVLDGKGQFPQLPGIALKYIRPMDAPCKEQTNRIDARLLEKVKKMDNYMLETNPLDYTSQKPSLTPGMKELFNSCVSKFDEKAAVIKLELVDYTPYIRLNQEQKLYVFGEIMKFVYLQCVETISMNVNPFAKQYTDMERDVYAPCSDLG
uniref:Uncharacterized protein n=1 Tax=Cacopsylla melanoneura TaxID=428564 RepID=A0A8D8M0R5_9HEMI